ncbi:MAG: ParA family protein [Verrucomicrobiia bacterium]
MEQGRKTRVIAVGNQKGGVGKTTNTVHIARALAEVGRKVLIIDLDMNHGATRHFGVEPEAFLGSFELMVGVEEPQNLVLSAEDKQEGVSLPVNVDLIPAARKLERIDQAISAKSKFVTPHEVLRAPLNALRGTYDYIFLDTAPNATLPTLAAYMNADYFILSAMPDPFAIAGLNDALRDIMDAKERGNSELVLLGVVISGVDKRTSLANTLSDFVEQSFRIGQSADSVKFKSTIGRSTVIPQTQKVGKTLFETHSTHKVTDEYRALAVEIETRLQRIEHPDAALAEVAPVVQEVVNG